MDTSFPSTALLIFLPGSARARIVRINLLLSCLYRTIHSSWHSQDGNHCSVGIKANAKSHLLKFRHCFRKHLCCIADFRNDSRHLPRFQYRARHIHRRIASVRQQISAVRKPHIYGYHFVDPGIILKLKLISEPLHDSVGIIFHSELIPEIYEQIIRSILVMKKDIFNIIIFQPQRIYTVRRKVFKPIFFLYIFMADISNITQSITHYSPTKLQLPEKEQKTLPFLP